MSPCVLLMLPALVAVGLQRSRWYPTLVFAAMAMAYAGTTVYFEAAYASGADVPFSPRKLKKFACYGLLAFGALHLIPWGRVFRIGGEDPKTRRWIDGFDLGTAVILGVLVSPLWSPCAGPTLGSILEYAQQPENAVAAFCWLLVFGLASMTPVIGISHVTSWLAGERRTRPRVHYFAAVGLGICLLLLSAAVLSKRDKRYESKMLHAMPDFYAWVGSF